MAAMAGMVALELGNSSEIWRIKDALKRVLSDIDALGRLKQSPYLCLRATLCVLLLVFALPLATASASDPTNVFTKLGTYTLAPNTELRLSLNKDNEVACAVTISNSQSKTTTSSSIKNPPNKPFVFFWDNDSRHLRWASSDCLAFEDLRAAPASTKVTVYDLAGGLQLKTLPPGFREIVQKMFP